MSRRPSRSRGRKKRLLESAEAATAAQVEGGGSHAEGGVHRARPRELRPGEKRETRPFFLRGHPAPMRAPPRAEKASGICRSGRAGIEIGRYYSNGRVKQVPTSCSGCGTAPPGWPKRRLIRPEAPSAARRTCSAAPDHLSRPTPARLAAPAARPDARRISPRPQLSAPAGPLLAPAAPVGASSCPRGARVFADVRARSGREPRCL
jgi:hypothetical protein